MFINISYIVLVDYYEKNRKERKNEMLQNLRNC